MAAKIKTDTTKLDNVLLNFVQFTERTIPVLVRQHARLLAVELANRTQPFSVGGKAKNAQIAGKNAVNNDVFKVFRSKKTLQSVIDKTRRKQYRDHLQDLLIKGNNKKIGEAFKSLDMIQDFELISKSAISAKHKSQRDKRTGRTFKPKDKMFIVTSGLPTYANKMEKRVGLSKSAWAHCARLIGGTKGDAARGIPAFAKSKNHQPHGKIIDRINKKNPYITMTSTIPWASRILRKDEIRFAQHIVREKMMKMANKMIKEAAKQNFKPIPEENE